MADWLKELCRERRFIVCLGSGGVGKTTISAALGLAGAAIGRRTLILTIDPARRLAGALGLPHFSHTIQRIDPGWLSEAEIPASGELYAMMLDTRRTSELVIKKYAPSPEVRERILQNPIYEKASTALGGSHDYMAMESLHQLMIEEDFDLMVLDTPPKTHALDFLGSPTRLLHGLDQLMLDRMLRPLASASRKGFSILSMGVRLVLRTISLFTGKALLTDLADFVINFSEMYEGFKDRASQTLEALQGPDSAFVIVTSPDPLTVDEAVFFRQRLGEENLPFAGYVANRVHMLGVEQMEGDLPEAREAARRLYGETCLQMLGPFMLTRLAGIMLANLEEYRLLARSDQESLRKLEAVEGGDLGEGEAPLTAVLPHFDHDIHDIHGLKQVMELLMAS